MNKMSIPGFFFLVLIISPVGHLPSSTVLFTFQQQGFMGNAERAAATHSLNVNVTVCEYSINKVCIYQLMSAHQEYRGGKY